MKEVQHCATKVKKVSRIFHDYYFFFQIEHQAHGAKSNDPVINTENDETLILSKGKHLSESNVKHETEIAFFKLNDYLQYQSTK